MAFGMPAQLATQTSESFFVAIDDFDLDTAPTSISPGNTAVGVDVLRHLVRATQDFELGNPPQTIAFATSGGENTALGEEAMREATYASDSTCVGSRSCRDQTRAYYNSALGHYALGFNILGWKNTAIGAFSMQGTETDTNAEENTAVGFRSLYSIDDGIGNLALGNDALLANADGDANTAVGRDCLESATSDYNTGVGSAALGDLTTGTLNTALGNQTGRGITTGSGNTVLGAGVGSLATGLTNNIIVANGTGAVKAQHDATNWTLTGGVIGTSTVTSSSTGSLGWAVVDGADDTACTTQCTSAAVFGFNLAAGATAPVLVGPSDATADICLCAGSS